MGEFSQGEDPGFWGIATPEKAAELVVELYGADAIKKLVSCAIGARADGREQDYRFWNDALKHLLRLH